ncbi:DUF5105 domain-containing protein [Romboutsia maritimum]|nr:DUF5105 domain-containing protein [Romboutsia maritimum]
MKNKIIYLLTVIISSISLVACTTNTPTSVVNNFFKDIKPQMQDYLKNTISNDKNTEKLSKEIQDELINKFSKVQGKVLSEKIDKDKAQVEVELRSINLGKILGEVFKENISQAFSGEELSEEAISNMLIEKIKEAQISTRKGTIDLVKVDGNWEIDNKKSLASLILGVNEEIFNDKSSES